jgi:hypothetical protein
MTPLATICDALHLFFLFTCSHDVINGKTFLHRENQHNWKKNSKIFAIYYTMTNEQQTNGKRRHMGKIIKIFLQSNSIKLMEILL